MNLAAWGMVGVTTAISWIFGLGVCLVCLGLHSSTTERTTARECSVRVTSRRTKVCGPADWFGVLAGEAAMAKAVQSAKELSLSNSARREPQ